MTVFMLEYDDERNHEDRLFNIDEQNEYAVGVYKTLVEILRSVYRDEEKKLGSEQADAVFLKRFEKIAFAEELSQFIRKYPDFSDRDFAKHFAAETEYFPGDI